MNNAAIQTLQTETDPKELLKAAATLANSDQQDDHQALVQHLAGGMLVAKLNTPDEYAGNRHRLRVRRILDTLVNNKAPVAAQSLVVLTRSASFLQEVARVELLILATAHLRPLPPDVLAFWDQYSQPEQETTTVVVQAIFINGTDSALSLFENKLRNPAFELDERIAWLRYEVVPNRDSTIVVTTCSRLLQSGLEDPLRSELIDVLFDYKPGVWYTPAVNYNAPPIDTYPPSTRRELLLLSDFALKNLVITEEQKNAINRTRAQLQ